MIALLSIKPEYAQQIFSGEKRFEFRRRLFARTDVTRVVVYCSHPIQQVIGEFTIEGVLSGTPTELWKQTSAAAGITRARFFKYFSGRETAYAIKVQNPILYKKPLCIRKDLKRTPPQSYMYLSEDVLT